MLCEKIRRCVIGFSSRTTFRMITVSIYYLRQRILNCVHSHTNIEQIFGWFETDRSLPREELAVETKDVSTCSGTRRNSPTDRIIRCTMDRFFITARALHNPDADPPSTRSYYQAINRQKQGFGLIKHWLSVPCNCCIYWTNQPKTMFKRLGADKALVVYTRQLLH